MASSLVAIVTGAARGIGFTISDYLLDSAYRVVLFDVKEKEGKEAESKLQEKHGAKSVVFIKGDASSKLELTAAFEKAETEFGRIDLLINNAAIVAELQPERSVAVNLIGPIYGCELALQYMGTSNNASGGVVINVSSISGLLPYPDTPTYVATKHGLTGLTRSYGVYGNAGRFRIGNVVPELTSSPKTGLHVFSRQLLPPGDCTRQVFALHDVHFKNNGVTFMAICPYYVNTNILKEAKTLGVCNPQNVESMTMPIERVKDGIKKLLEDKHNGSILLVLSDSMEYVEISENLRRIPTTII